MEINKFFDKADVAASGEYDPGAIGATLDRAIARHSSHYARMAYKCALAKKQSLLAKHEYTVIKAEVSMEVSMELAARGNKATAQMIEDRVLTNPRVRAAMDVMIEAQTIEQLGSDLLDSVQQRGNLLITTAKLRMSERAMTSGI